MTGRSPSTPIDALAAADVGEILVVTGHDADEVEAALRLPGARSGSCVTPRYRDGQSTSLAAALHALDDDSEAAVVPDGRPAGRATDDVGALIDGFRRTRQAIVRLRYDDGPGPALLSREIYAEAGHLHGDTGARVLMASHPEWVHEVRCHGPAPPRRRRARGPAPPPPRKGRLSVTQTVVPRARAEMLALIEDADSVELKLTSPRPTATRRSRRSTSIP